MLAGHPASTAGETIDVPAATNHTFRNAGDDDMRVLFEFRPALDSTERFYELYFAFAQEGRVNAKAMPGLLDILLLRALAPVARVSGRRAPRCERVRAGS